MIILTYEKTMNPVNKWYHKENIIDINGLLRIWVVSIGVKEKLLMLPTIPTPA